MRRYGHEVGCAVAILLGYALASSLVASSDSPLRPVAGDVVTLRPGVVTVDVSMLPPSPAMTVPEPGEDPTCLALVDR